MQQIGEDGELLDAIRRVGRQGPQELPHPRARAEPAATTSVRRPQQQEPPL